MIMKWTVFMGFPFLGIPRSVRWVPWSEGPPAAWQLFDYPIYNHNYTLNLSKKMRWIISWRPFQSKGLSTLSILKLFNSRKTPVWKKLIKMVWLSLTNWGTAQDTREDKNTNNFIGFSWKDLFWSIDRATRRLQILANGVGRQTKPAYTDLSMGEAVAASVLSTATTLWFTDCLSFHNDIYIIFLIRPPIL